MPGIESFGSEVAVEVEAVAALLWVSKPLSQRFVVASQECTRHSLDDLKQFCVNVSLWIEF